jgi:hypothetical protein
MKSESCLLRTLLPRRRRGTNIRFLECFSFESVLNRFTCFNEHGGFGKWAFDVVFDPAKIPDAVTESTGSR